MKKKEKTTVMDRVKERQDIEARIRECSNALSFSQADSLSRTAGETASRLASLIAQHGSEAQIPAGRLDAFNELKIKAKETKDAATFARQRNDALRAEIDGLKTKLAAIPYGCEEEELLAHQAELDAAMGQVKQLTAALAIQEQNAQAAAAHVPTMDDLTEQRQTLLAEIAIGATGQEEALARLNEQMDSRRREIAEAQGQADELAGQALETAAGLRRKLWEAQGRVAELQGEIIPHCLSNYLIEQAEAAALDYVRQAEALLAKHRQIMGIGQLLKTLPDGKELVSYHGLAGFKIPGFVLDNCPPLAGASRGEIATFAHGPDGIESAAMIERENLRAMGISI